MPEKVSVTLELRQGQLEFLEEMAQKYNLPDRSKALRCLVTFAMKEKAHETSIFTEIRCNDDC